jgi:transposase
LAQRREPWIPFPAVFLCAHIEPDVELLPPVLAGAELTEPRWPWSVIVAVLFTSTSTINRWRLRYLESGVQTLLEGTRARRWAWQWWAVLVVEWVTLRSPRDFGFYRSRWTCGAIVTLLAEDYHVQVSRETVRRRLHEDDLVWRRPRPVLGPKDPQRATKLRKIRALLRNLPANERPTRLPCSRTKWTSTPIPRSARCGCAGGSRPRWRAEKCHKDYLWATDSNALFVSDTTCGASRM